MQVPRLSRLVKKELITIRSSVSWQLTPRGGSEASEGVKCNKKYWELGD